MELDAHGLVAYAEEVEALASAAAALGVHVGLRRLEHEPMALARLHLLPLAYVKLGSDFAQQAATSPGSLHLLQAIVETATGLGIQVIVNDSVNAETAQLLHKHNALTPAA